MPKRKNSPVRRVRSAYRQDLLASACMLHESNFGAAFGMETISVNQPWPHDYYHFRDNGSRVLATAHLDTVVQPAGRKPHFTDTAHGPRIQSGALDDRLGAYVILHLLPALGVTCDWLLTVGEESAQSTAGKFKPAKDYDWIIEFDRGGADVVMYQYEDDATCQLVEAVGAQVGFGSYSDIAYLEHLGVKAFNWGVGYQGNYHSEAGYAFLEDTFTMVAQYLRFHEQNAGTTLPHKKQAHGYRTGRSLWYDDIYGDCEFCGTKESVDLDTGYCLYCDQCRDCGGTDPDASPRDGHPDYACQCWVPPGSRKDAPTGQKKDWREMTWGEYCELRPGEGDCEYDDVVCAECSLHVARCECMEWEGDPDSQVVRLPVSQADDLELEKAYRTALDREDDLPASRGSSPSIAPPWSGTRTAEDAHRKLGYREIAESDAWHEGTKDTLDGLYCMGHFPRASWKNTCKGCRARYPDAIVTAMPGTDTGHLATSATIAGVNTWIGSHKGFAASGIAVEGCTMCDAEITAARELTGHEHAQDYRPPLRALDAS